LEENHPMATPQVSILIPVFNQLALTRNCLKAIQDNSPHDSIEVIVIDNGSTDGTSEFLARWRGPFPLQVICNHENRGFARANNQGAQIARGDYLVLLNNDTVPQPNWLPPLLEIFRDHDDVGAVGSKLLFPDGTIQHAGVITAKDDVRDIELMPLHIGYRNQDEPIYNKLRRFRAVTAACMIIPTPAYKLVGGLDDAYWNGFEDVDFCFKLLDAGFDIFFQPESVVIHYESQSGEQRFVHETDNLRTLNHRWGNKITCEFLLREGNIIVPNDGVTIVIVTYNSSATIEACLTSLINTLRPHDEVVIVDNASSDQTIEAVHRYTADKDGFRLLPQARNLGYAHAANIGAQAGGNPFIVFLNPDTIVTPQWIERLLFHLKSHKVSATGPLSDYVAGEQRLDQHLPAEMISSCGPGELPQALWKRNARQSNPAKLLIGFCLMVKRKSFEHVGGLDKDLFLGNDDLDLSWRLRAAGHRLVVATDTLVFHKGQESFRSDPRSLTDRLVQESTDYLHFKLMHHYGMENIPSSQELWGIDWFKPSCILREDLPLTSVIVLTYNQLNYTQQCIESLFCHTPSPFELIIVDNGSSDGTVDYLANLDRSQTACLRIHIIANPDNRGFAAGCNQGLAEARGRYCLLLNNDIVVTPAWLTKLIQPMGHEHIGFSGPMSNCVSGRQRVSDVAYDTASLKGLDRFAREFGKRHTGQVIQQKRLVGFCLLIKRELIDRIGGLDERFKVGNFEDDDFCLRAVLAGYKGAIVKDCFVHHYGNQSFKGNRIDFNQQLLKNWDVFKAKWHIPPETPYTGQYQVPNQSRWADSANLYIPVCASNQQTKKNRENTTRSGHEHQMTTNPQPAGVNCFADTHPKGRPPEGASMQILDHVLKAVKEQLSAQQHDVAKWILERIIEVDPQHGSAHHELGMLYYEQNELAKAQSHLHQCVRYSPDNPAALKDLGDFYHVVHKDGAKALQFYKAAIELGPNDSQLLLTAGHISTAQRFFDDAMSYYQRVLEIDPHNQEARDCFEQLKASAEPAPVEETAEHLYLQAQSKIQSGDRAGAQTILKNIIDKYPGHALAHNDYAVLAYESGEKDQALKHYEHAVSLNPENILFLKNLADFHWHEQSDSHAAMELYVRILGEDPCDVETILGCAQICVTLGRHADAREFVERAQTLDPFNEHIQVLNDQLSGQPDTTNPLAGRDALYNEAKDKAAQGDLESAVELLTQLVGQYRQDANAFNDLGVLHYELGEKEKALGCYREAVNLAPDQATFCKNLADFYLVEQGRAEDAMQLYLSVLEKNQTDVDCLLATGIVCMLLNQTDDARTFFERVTAIEPANQKALQSLEQLDARLRDGAGTRAEGSDIGSREQKAAIG
jgi:GT2 family glycosyltransferase/tetratricopeptide (TPR) repeat protein